MKKYKAIFFDLCDTLMPFNNRRLPEVLLDGRSVRSTSPVVYEIFAAWHSHVSFEDFHRCFADCYEEVLAIREREKVEIPSPERFRRLLDRLAVPRDDGFDALVQQIVSGHMSRISTCLEMVPDHKALLDRLRTVYRLALVSNFDYTPTVHSVLKREGIFDHFNAVFVSADLGLRKPHPDLFILPCRTLHLAIHEVLFVGDSVHLDVVGAKGVGMDVAWFNPERKVYSGPPEKTPDYTLSLLSDLEEILNV